MIKKIFKAFRFIREYGRVMPKTTYFNLKYFPFRIAIKLPIIVSNNVKLQKTDGKITLDLDEKEIKTGMIKIGYGEARFFDAKYERFIWDVSGEVVFKGQTDIGQGTRIWVGPNGLLVFGKNFRINAKSTILCSTKIIFGDDNALGWEVMIVDTDFHKMLWHGELKNENQEIIIGNHNWVGFRAIIMKGASIDDNNVVGANSLLRKKIEGNDLLIMGIPAQVKKEGISWEF